MITEIEKRFDEQFCREDLGPEKRGKMDRWFIRDDITGRAIKSFYRHEIVNLLREIVGEVHDELYLFPADHIRELADSIEKP